MNIIGKIPQVEKVVGVWRLIILAIEEGHDKVIRRSVLEIFESEDPRRIAAKMMEVLTPEEFQMELRKRRAGRIVV